MATLKSYKDIVNEVFKKSIGYNPRTDSSDDFVPSNKAQFMVCANDVMQNMTKGSLDQFVSKLGQGMLDFWNDNRKSLEKDIKSEMKDIHGKLEESKIERMVKNVDDAIKYLDTVTDELKSNKDDNKKLWSRAKDLETLAQRIMELSD